VISWRERNAENRGSLCKLSGRRPLSFRSNHHHGSRKPNQPFERLVGLVPEADLPGTNKSVCTFARNQCNFAYSALACFRIGMSGSASFQRARKSSYHLRAETSSPIIFCALAICKCASAPITSIATKPL
jgi:hypothetical protein